ncbi:MAG: phosphatidylserine decarboxylase family protein [Bacteroidales bacterium]|nr:phosphatidylserine decarboxylase family protein [Bacteroidales bacterium]MDD5974657.1 phosphatidylserine decarboxylase family protein [Bacteroidales bacterium]MDY5193285.1 phosphatidylserine decarboxylase family protein [Candidatus Aphodosoma sp.]
MKKRRIRVHKEGYSILFWLILLLTALNFVVYIETPSKFIFLINLLVSILALSFFLYFFRNPAREVEVDEDNLIIAPADGRIVVIEPVEEYEYFNGQKMMQISIFMSVFSVHANWIPLSGTVKYVRHYKGRHMAAYLPKSSHENEHSSVVIENSNGQQIMMRQIAGALARRIVTYVAENTPCNINEHLGFIKFGSRVDLFIPADSEIFVDLGEHTIGNETIIARLPK